MVHAPLSSEHGKNLKPTPPLCPDLPPRHYRGRELPSPQVMPEKLLLGATPGGEVGTLGHENVCDLLVILSRAV